MAVSIRSRAFKEPILSKNGKIYCSDWCGMGCTKAQHDRAVEEATKLIKILGPGWEAEVWENVGWHYQAMCGHFSVTPQGMRDEVYGYTAQYGHSSFYANGATPEEAIGTLAHDMRTYIHRLNGDLEELVNGSKRDG